MTMPIQILGVEGYSKTNLLKVNVSKALERLNLRVGIEEISDVDRLMNFNITSTPALVVKDQVVLENEIPSVEDLTILLQHLFLPEQYLFDIGHILVPTDFSPVARNAYQYARHFAAVRGSTIEVLHVLQSEVEQGLLYLPDHAKERAKKQLIDFVREDPAIIEGNTLQKVRITQYIEMGFPGQKIVQLSKKASIGLIVMGTTGASGLLKKLLGSVSAYVSQRAYCPVLLVPQQATYKKINNILYASNRNVEDERMMKQMIDLAMDFNAAIHFVHVNEDIKGKPKNTAIHFEQWFKAGTPEVAFHLVNIDGKDVLSGLNAYAQSNQIDLMVMATARRSFIKDLFHKSVTKKVVLNTKIPLMIMHFDN